MDIQLVAICTNIVDFCRPAHYFVNVYVNRRTKLHSYLAYDHSNINSYIHIADTDLFYKCNSIVTNYNTDEQNYFNV